jgi:ATP-dependent Clp protease ATP-binding subunit ClpA
MEKVIEQLSRLVAELMQQHPEAKPEELETLLQQALQVDIALAASLRQGMTQSNSDNARGYQTLVQGGVAYIGDRFQVDGETLQSVLEAFLKTNFNQPSTPQAEKPAELPNNLNRARTGAVNFVGREDAMAQLHHQLQQQERIAITAVVTGMAGVGKTELALQYALHHKEKLTYAGGICWIGVQGEQWEYNY